MLVALAPGGRALPVAPARLASPRATMETFLRAMDRYAEAGALSPQRVEAVEALRSTMDLSSAGKDSAERAAIDLLAVLNRIGRVEPLDLPDADFVRTKAMAEFRFFPDETRAAHRELDRAGAVGEIVFVRGADGAWRLSATTVAGANRLYKSVERMPIRYGADERSLSTSLWIRSQMPRELREREALGLELWQWLALLVIMFLGVFLDFVVQVALGIAVGARLRRSGQEIEKGVLKRAVRPFGLFAGALVVLLLMRLARASAFGAAGHLYRDAADFDGCGCDGGVPCGGRHH